MGGDEDEPDGRGRFLLLVTPNKCTLGMLEDCSQDSSPSEARGRLVGEFAGPLLGALEAFPFINGVGFCVAASSRAVNLEKQMPTKSNRAK